MKSFKILAGFMVVFLVAFLCMSAAAHAKNDDDSRSGHKKKGKKLPKHAQVLQAQIDVNKASIESIELTPGPMGDKGDKGDPGNNGTDGADGADGQDGDDGDDGLDGASIQGPPGAPGTSRWVDGSGTVSTTGSVQLGSDTADGTTTCNTANEGTIRYNTSTKIFEGCDGTAWISLSPVPIPYSIGDMGPGGGIVYYTNAGGRTGLEAAWQDQSGSANWANAVKLAAAYKGGGKGDWHLPSKVELDLMYQQKAVVGSAPSSSYWSSTNTGFGMAWYQHFGTGGQGVIHDYESFSVRAVRAF